MKDQTPEEIIDGWLAKTGGYAKDMTLRDAMAIAAMQALITHVDYRTFPDELLSQDAYAIANAMLKAKGV